MERKHNQEISHGWYFMKHFEYSIIHTEYRLLWWHKIIHLMFSRSLWDTYSQMVDLVLSAQEQSFQMSLYWQQHTAQMTIADRLTFDWEQWVERFSSVVELNIFLEIDKSSFFPDKFTWRTSWRLLWNWGKIWKFSF